MSTFQDRQAASGQRGGLLFKNGLAATMFNNRLDALRDIDDGASLKDAIAEIYRDYGTLVAGELIDHTESEPVFLRVLKDRVITDRPPSSRQRAKLPADFEKFLASAYEEGLGRPLEDAFPRPDRCFFGAAEEVPEFPIDVLPEPYRSYCRGHAEESGFSPDYLGMSLIVSAAVAMGCVRMITPVAGTSYVEPPIIWAVLVGETAQAKTPALSHGTAGLRGVEAALVTKNNEALRAHRQRGAVAKEVRRQWEKAVKEAIENKAPQPPMPLEAIEPEPFVPERVRIKDATPEVVSLIAKASPRGILLESDELSGWWKSWDRYSGKGGASGEREMWLEAHNGGSHTVDRVKFNGVPRYIERFAVSVLGGAQPEKVREFVNSGDDGMMGRFLWVYPRLGGTLIPYDKVPAKPYFEALLRLHGLEFITDEKDKLKPLVVALSHEALKRLESFKMDIKAEMRVSSPARRGMLAKSEKHVLRLALVLAFMEWSGGPEGAAEPYQIPLRAMEGALRLWCDYFAPQADRIVALKHRDKKASTAADLARYLLDNPITRRISKTEVRSSGCAPEIEKAEVAADALTELANAGWVFADHRRAGGGPGRLRLDYIVNPRLYSR